MAKSLRSKWKRKMKAIKRVRYSDKELIRLKTMIDKSQQKDTNNDKDKDISLRSKWKRKMKAIKRVRYSDKELIRLKTMIDKSQQKDTNNDKDKDIVMKSIGSEKEVKEALLVDTMETTGSESVVTPKPKLLDEFGHYPQWMNQRQVKKQQNKRKVKRLKSKRK
ncbi:unnamed protein product [Oppiella nova]|uniref:Protein LLP homolog n=1 Tax=Oppiella nova TaxID=334625 RepID=A0A7R9M0W1_9ACAR|nr:unnamed protein product [Oppiella nova]CAG2168266.1 unnamed protein product [Oppiella nova]